MLIEPDPTLEIAFSGGSHHFIGEFATVDAKPVVNWIKDSLITAGWSLEESLYSYAAWYGASFSSTSIPSGSVTPHDVTTASRSPVATFGGSGIYFFDPYRENPIAAGGAVWIPLGLTAADSAGTYAAAAATATGWTGASGSGPFTLNLQGDGTYIIVARSPVAGPDHDDDPGSGVGSGPNAYVTGWGSHGGGNQNFHGIGGGYKLRSGDLQYSITVYEGGPVPTALVPYLGESTYIASYFMQYAGWNFQSYGDNEKHTCVLKVEDNYGGWVRYQLLPGWTGQAAGIDTNRSFYHLTANPSQVAIWAEGFAYRGNSCFFATMVRVPDLEAAAALGADYTLICGGSHIFDASDDPGSPAYTNMGGGPDNIRGTTAWSGSFAFALNGPLLMARSGFWSPNPRANPNNYWWGAGFAGICDMFPISLADQDGTPMASTAWALGTDYAADSHVLGIIPDAIVAAECWGAMSRSGPFGTDPNPQTGRQYVGAHPEPNLTVEKKTTFRGKTFRQFTMQGLDTAASTYASLWICEDINHAAR